MTPRARPTAGNKRRAERNYDWPPKQESKSTLAKPERESTFERFRIARMPEILRHRYVEYRTAERRLAETITNLLKLKKEFAMQEKIWAKKRQNPEYSEMDSTLDNQNRENYLKAIKDHEESIPRHQENLKVAKQNWIETRKAIPGIY